MVAISLSHAAASVSACAHAGRTPTDRRTDEVESALNSTIERERERERVKMTSSSHPQQFGITNGKSHERGQLGISVKEMASSLALQKKLEQEVLWYPDIVANVSTGGGGTIVEGNRPTSITQFLLQAGWFCVKTLAYTYLVHRLFGMAGELLESIDPNHDEKKQAAGMRSALEKRLRKSGREVMNTTMHENLIAQDLINPEDIKISFADIGGLGHQKREIYNLVVLPLRRPELFVGKGKLYRPPQGLLLHGRPGTGKTMLAKAIAKECGAAFINLRLSTIMNKYFGESQQLVRALFSLARKLSPTIVFIDEIDGFLRARSADDHHCLANMKAEFMQLWDGMLTESLQDPSERNQFGVVVIGASNRVGDIDAAILRRMPRTFAVGLPDEKGRESILRIMLRDETLEPDFDFGAVAADEVTDGFSGADLKELCRAAAMRPLQDLLREESESSSSIEDASTLSTTKSVRPLETADLLHARKDVRPPEQTMEQADEVDGPRRGTIDPREAFPFLMNALLGLHSKRTAGNND